MGLRRIFGDAGDFQAQNARLCTVECPEYASGVQVRLRRTSPLLALKSALGERQDSSPVRKLAAGSKVRLWRTTGFQPGA